MRYPMEDDRPWYRQFWPWFLIALPATAVAGGIATVMIAMHEPDGLVVDDYYEAGLAINHTLERDRVADRLGVTADVRFEDGRVRVRLDSEITMPRPELHMRLLHPTRANQDVGVPLTFDAATGAFVAPIEVDSPGNWHVLIEPHGQSWRLTGRVRLPGERSLELRPAVG